MPFCVTGRRTSRNKTEVESFWHALVWLADTILFIWVGIMLAFVLLKPSDQSVRIMGDEFIIQNQLKGIDAAYGLLLYAWLLVSLPVCIPNLLAIGFATPPLSASTVRNQHGLYGKRILKRLLKRIEHHKRARGTRRALLMPYAAALPLCGCPTSPTAGTAGPHFQIKAFPFQCSRAKIIFLKCRCALVAGLARCCVVPVLPSAV